MLTRTRSFLAVLTLLVSFAGTLSAKDDELKPEDLVARHLESLGSPDALAQVTTRSISGVSTFKFISGATGQMAGKGQWVSEKGKMGIVLQYGGTEYPGEHFAYDGKDAMIDYIKTGQRSPLGDFLYGYSGILKNELLGGVFNLGWPLLSFQESGMKLKPKKKTVDGRELYEVECMPKKAMENVKVKLSFDSSFRHVTTEYRLRLLLRDTVTNYVITEKFDDFKTADGITLPYKYSLSFLFEGGSSSLQTMHTFDVEKISHNGKIDPRFYVAQK